MIIRNLLVAVTLILGSTASSAGTEDTPVKLTFISQQSTYTVGDTFWIKVQASTGSGNPDQDIKSIRLRLLISTPFVELKDIIEPTGITWSSFGFPDTSSESTFCNVNGATANRIGDQDAMFLLTGNQTITDTPSDMIKLKFRAKTASGIPTTILSGIHIWGDGEEVCTPNSLVEGADYEGQIVTSFGSLGNLTIHIVDP